MGMAMAASFSSAAIFDVVYTIGTNGIPTIDGYGDPSNVVITDNYNTNYGLTGVHVIGIGWNVNISAFGASWLSESRLAFENTSQADGVFLGPGAGNNTPGNNVNFTSGGVVDLVGPALDFFLDGDDTLRLEWFESFDDVPDAIDGLWHEGSQFTVRVDATAVPEPATMAVLGLGAAALLRRRRK